MKTNLRAFTLIEILIVLAIFGLLVGVAISNTDKIFGRSQEAIARIFVRDSLKTSLTRYRIDLGDFPNTTDGLNALLSVPSSRAELWQGPYAETPGGTAPLDPWGEPYQYRYPGTKNKASYDLFSKGPDKTEGSEDDIGNW